MEIIAAEYNKQVDVVLLYVEGVERIIDNRSRIIKVALFVNSERRKQHIQKNNSGYFLHYTLEFMSPY
jgi:hypothetical protein